MAVRHLRRIHHHHFRRIHRRHFRRIHHHHSAGSTTTTSAGSTTTSSAGSTAATSAGSTAAILIAVVVDDVYCYRAHTVHRAIGIVIPHFVSQGERRIQGIVVLFRFYREVQPLVPVRPIEFPSERRYPPDALVVAIAAPRTVDLQHDPPILVSVLCRWLSQSHAIADSFSFPDGQRARRHLDRPVPVVLADLGVDPRLCDGTQRQQREAEVDETPPVASEGQARLPGWWRQHIPRSIRVRRRI